jgi:hypothetical protein
MPEPGKKTELENTEAPKTKSTPPSPAPKRDDGKWKELGFNSQAAYQNFLNKGL